MTNERMNDLSVVNLGSLVAIRPLSETGKRWMEEHIDAEAWQWFGARSPASRAMRRA